MNRSATIILLCALALTARAQNLVPNPSFEQMSSCPTTLGQIAYSTPWTNPTTNTPDYFNQCNGGAFSVPNNSNGSQIAQTGVAYAGIYTFFQISPDEREYIQVKLNDTLIFGKKYLVSFYVALADNMQYAANSIGAYFSSNAVGSSNNNILPFTPQVQNPSSNVLSDKTNWIEIRDTLYAQGGELFMTIGNFKTDSISDTLFLGNGTPGWNYAYYYIDDVSVIDLGWVGIDNANGNNFNIKISPNPNGGQMTIDYSLKEKGEFTLYDITGKKVASYSLEQTNNSLKIDQQNLQAGVYSYKVEVSGKIAKQNKIVIIK